MSEPAPESRVTSVNTRDQNTRDQSESSDQPARGGDVGQNVDGRSGDGRDADGECGTGRNRDDGNGDGTSAACTSHSDADRPSLGLLSGVLLVVANMIGVGVFTSLGFQLASIQSTHAVIAAWIVGGIAAFFGALAYAELVAVFPKNGGEYQLLSRIYHPSLGFSAGCASLLVGFCAPIAASASAFGTYLNAVFPWVSPLIAGLLLIWGCAAAQSVHVGFGSRFQNAWTVGKVLLILVFIVAGFVSGDPSRINASLKQTFTDGLTSSAFAVSLIYISYAYLGWNAAAYVAGEIREPRRNVPIALGLGTLIVGGLYVAVNVVFLTSAPASDLIAAQEKVGHVAAIGLFGEHGGRLMSTLIAIGLVSTVGAMSLAGPRVYEAIGHDFPAFRWLSIRRANGGPIVASVVQASLATALLVSASFDTLIKYVALTLSGFNILTVLGVYVLRRRDPHASRPFRAWGYPFTPLLFLMQEAWMITFTVKNNLVPALASLVTISTGVAIYFVVRQRSACESNPVHQRAQNQ